MDLHVLRREVRQRLRHTLPQLPLTDDCLSEVCRLMMIIIQQDGEAQAYARVPAEQWPALQVTLNWMNATLGRELQALLEACSPRQAADPTGAWERDAMREFIDGLPPEGRG